MSRLENLWPSHKKRHGGILLILLAISLLTVSLGTRTSTPVISHGVALDWHSPRAIRQHLATDAAHWVPPVAIVMANEIVQSYPLVSTGHPPIPSVFFESSLYNRPPPGC